MPFASLLQQLLLYVHLFAFAVAFVQVIRLDLAWLRMRDLQAIAFAPAARIVLTALVVLWLSGSALILLMPAMSWQTFVASPKLVAKLLVVTVLSVNGVALHRFALPRLQLGKTLSAWILGAISSASWSAAALIGGARHVASFLRLTDYLAGYSLWLAAAVGCSLVLRRRLHARDLPLDARPAPVDMRSATSTGTRSYHLSRRGTLAQPVCDWRQGSRAASSRSGF